MDWKDVAKTAGDLGLKVIGGALGGPAGASFGGQVAEWLGLSSDAVPREVDQALRTASPETMLRLKEIEADMEKARISAGLEHRRIDTADIQKSRSRDLQLKQAGYHNYRADIMLALAFGALVTIVVLINGNASIKPEVLAIFNMAVGALLKMISDAFQFEFGSSRGSKEKDLQMSKGGNR